MCGKKLKSCKKTDKVKSIMLFSWAKAARDFKKSISEGARKKTSTEKRIGEECRTRSLLMSPALASKVF